MLLNIYTPSEGKGLLSIYIIQIKDNFVILYDIHYILKRTFMYEINIYL